MKRWNGVRIIGLEWHEIDSKPVGLLKAIFIYAMLLIIEPIKFSTKLRWILDPGFGLM